MPTQTQTVLVNTRVATAATLAELDKIKEFLGDLKPLRFAEVRLRPLKPQPGSQCEVVAPGTRRIGDPVKLLQLLEGSPRKTFGRGELTIV